MPPGRCVTEKYFLLPHVQRHAPAFHCGYWNLVVVASGSFQWKVLELPVESFGASSGKFQWNPLEPSSTTDTLRRHRLEERCLGL